MTPRLLLLMLLVFVFAGCEEERSVVGTWLHQQPTPPGVPPPEYTFAENGTMTMVVALPDGTTFTHTATYVVEKKQITITYDAEDAVIDSKSPGNKAEGEQYAGVEEGTIEFLSDDEFTLTINDSVSRYLRAPAAPEGASTP